MNTHHEVDGGTRMNCEIDGVCIGCGAGTPVSGNTITSRGVMCSVCMDAEQDAASLAAHRVRRLRMIEDERYRLVRALGASFEPMRN